MAKRVFIFEVSGPTLDFIRKYADQLPAIRHFLDNGAWSQLKGPLQPVLPTSFGTLLSGKNPGKTGLFDSFKFPAGCYERKPFSSDSLGFETFYQHLSKAGIQVGLLNVPLTWQLPEVNGFLVSGDEGIGEDYAYPSEIQDQLKNSGYFVPFGASYSPGREMNFFKHCLDVLEMRRCALRLLFRNQQWQFGMLTLYVFGELMHAFWKYYDRRHPDFRPVSEVFGSVDPFLEGLKSIDRILNEITELSGPDSLIILLGAWGHRLEHSKVHLNTFLEQKGYLRFKKTLTSGIKYIFYQTGLTASMAEKVFHRLNLYKFIRYKMKSGQRAAVSSSTFLSYQDVDWSRTKAVAMGYLGQIFLNVYEHRPAGVVRKDDYPSERGRLRRLLEDLRDPSSGRQIVDRVFSREEIYSGQELMNAPDLVVKFREGYSGESGFSGGSKLVTKSPPNHSSDHWTESMFLASGRGIRPGEVKARLEDIAPTVLHYLAVNVSQDYDGVSLPIFV
ncbi:MAG: alkaline phosphatase family protein [Planctomycetota bacterium]|jgi:predicted AlkP superfamily phosphohydrolase/phosphomutase